VYEFDTFDPEYLNVKHEDEWASCGNYARDMISKVLKVKLSEQGGRDSQEYGKKLREFEKQRKEEKKAA